MDVKQQRRSPFSLVIELLGHSGYLQYTLQTPICSTFTFRILYYKDAPACLKKMTHQLNVISSWANARFKAVFEKRNTMHPLLLHVVTSRGTRALFWMVFDTPCQLNLKEGFSATVAVMFVVPVCSGTKVKIGTPRPP